MAKEFHSDTNGLDISRGNKFSKEFPLVSETEPHLIPIYKVNVIKLIIGCFIENFDCNSYMFLDESKALNFAHELATEYYEETGELPKEDNKEKMEEEIKSKGKKLKKRRSYSWLEDGWKICSIKVVKDVLNLGNEIINQTKFSDGR